MYLRNHMQSSSHDLKLNINILFSYPAFVGETALYVLTGKTLIYYLLNPAL